MSSLVFHVDFEKGVLLAADGSVVGETEEGDVFDLVGNGPPHEFFTKLFALALFCFRLEDVLFVKIQNAWGASCSCLEQVLAQKICHKR